MKLCKKVRRRILRATAPKASRKLWHTKDGRVMQIRDMEDSHLLNSIRYLYGKKHLKPSGWEYARAMRAEARRRGLPSNAELPGWLARKNEKFLAAAYPPIPLQTTCIGPSV